jgi:hypothetical protein
VTVAAASPADSERRFEEAMGWIAAGQSSAAVPILRRLYRETKAPRVRLELARALMLSGESALARQVFVEAYEDDPPPQVKSMILNFIDQIDQRDGKLTMSVSISKYGNPLHQPSSYGIDFGGFVLQLATDPKTRNVVGTGYGVRYEKSLPAQFDFVAGFFFQDLYNKALDQTSLDLSVGKTLTSMPIQLRIGVQSFDMKQQSFRLPYASTAYRVALSQRLAIIPKIQIGYWGARAGEGLSGSNIQISAPIVYAFDPATTLSVGPRVEVHNAKFREQAYRTATFNLDFSTRTRFINLNVTAYPRLSDFDATDPVWGKRRSDHGFYFAAQVSSDKMRYGGFLPQVGFYCDINRSNITFFSQSDCNFNGNLQKIF